MLGCGDVGLHRGWPGATTEQESGLWGSFLRFPCMTLGTSAPFSRPLLLLLKWGSGITRPQGPFEMADPDSIYWMYLYLRSSHTTQAVFKETTATKSNPCTKTILTNYYTLGLFSHFIISWWQTSPHLLHKQVVCKECMEHWGVWEHWGSEFKSQAHVFPQSGK